MAKKRCRKELSKIDLLRSEYDDLARDSQEKLQKIMDAVSGGVVPEEDQVQDFKASVTRLREEYDKIRAIAGERLGGSELPPEGSPAKDFLDVLNEKNAAELAACRKKALEVLKRFGKIWSDDKYYLGLLEDHKKAGYENIRILEDPEAANAEFAETEEYELIMAPAETFLKALDCEDPDSEEGIELLDKVCGYFSLNAAVGIMQKQYYFMKYGW